VLHVDSIVSVSYTKYLAVKALQITGDEYFFWPHCNSHDIGELLFFIICLEEMMNHCIKKIILAKRCAIIL